MDPSAVEYYRIILDIIIATAVSVVLLIFARRVRREKTFSGYSRSPRVEKYAGYALLSIGIAIIALSVLQLVILLSSNYYSDIPFGLGGLQMRSGNQTTDLVSGQLLGMTFGGTFWMLIFGCGGKLFSMGTNLLMGTQVKIIKQLRS